MQCLLVGGLVEHLGCAVDLVSGQQEGGDGAGRQALLLGAVEVCGDLVPDVDGLRGGELVSFEAQLVELVEQLRGRTGRRLDVDGGIQPSAVDLDVGAVLVGTVARDSPVSAVAGYGSARRLCWAVRPHGLTRLGGHAGDVVPDAEDLVGGPRERISRAPELRSRFQVGATGAGLQGPQAGDRYGLPG
ncbi:hypothetical protein [Streptomyces werraensis]|uniref:hypothetical protein n=1 Tax=Streptomyces werraensis TaxID=68284 RepID=UPI00341ED1FF